MVAQEKMQGNWEQVKGKLREKWGQLTDSDLTETFGNMEQVAGVIQRKTGEGREAIEAYLRDVSRNASSAMGAASEKVRDYARQATESLADVQKQAMDQFGASYTEAQRFVREQPGISLALCFGAGVLTGLFIGMSRRS